MAIAVATSRQALADAYKNLAGTATAWVALHTAEPTTVGQYEITGGSPAYARKQITWTSGTGGVLTAANVTFDVPAGTAVWASLNTASTAGSMIDKQALSPSITTSGQGTITVTVSFSVS